MNDYILISIIVPAYNLENYLENTINSILAQTHKNIEVIIVNDGSKDGTWSVIDKFFAKDKRVIGIDKENGGVTSARIEGLKRAQGDYIGFVDGDDLVDPDMFERLLNNAIEYNADISHCGYKKVLKGKTVYYYNTGRLVKQDKETGLKDLLEGSFVEPALCNKLYKHTLFHSLLHDSVMDISIKHFEDLLMNYYLFKESDSSIFEDFCPYNYVVREGSATKRPTSVELIYDPSHVREIIINDLEKCGYHEGAELHTTAKTALLRLYISAYTMLLRNDAKHLAEHKKVFRDKIKKNRNYIKNLNRGGKIHARAIIYAPHLCKPIFKLLNKI